MGRRVALFTHSSVRQTKEWKTKEASGWSVFRPLAFFLYGCHHVLNDPNWGVLHCWITVCHR